MDVLIAEKGSDVLQRLRELILDVDGVDRVTGGTDTGDIIRKLYAGIPDLLILDMQIGSHAAVRILELVQFLPRRPEIIALSDYSYFQYRSTCSRLGVNYFLNKSHEFTRLSGIIRNYCNNCSAETAEENV